jgi:3-oxoacyl-(acyl-carrier-protein) synthase
MTEPDRPAEGVVITGMAAVSACGRGVQPLVAGAAQGTPAFAPVTRFDPSRYRTKAAAHVPGRPDLLDELVGVVRQAGADAGLTAAQRATSRLLLAARCDPQVARMPAEDKVILGVNATAAEVASRCGLAGATRVYTNACVAGSTAVADAAAAISQGRAERLVVAAGFLVDEYHFALFDAGRALAGDGAIRAFSLRRKGLLLGDGVAAVVVESAGAARGGGARVLARLTGWGRAGDAHHVSQPDPEGAGLARAIRLALHRAGRHHTDIGYVNAHGTGTTHSDAAEAAALHRVFGETIERVPVSSSKSVHGHTLEASGLLELVVTVAAVESGRLPVNAGFLEPDERCRLNLVREPTRRAVPRALTLNCAFGGANTALVVEAG